MAKRATPAWSASGAGRAETPVVCGPARDVAGGPEVTGAAVLAVLDEGGPPLSDTGDRGHEPVDIVEAAGHPGAGSYGARDDAAIGVKDSAAVRSDVVMGE